MNSFRHIQLGADAIVYMRECLAGGHTLAKLLMSRPDLEQGSIFAPVPLGIRKEAVGNFRYGPLLPQPAISDRSKETSTRIVPVPNTNYILEQLIRNDLKQNEHKACLFEDALALPSDPYLKNLRIKKLIHDTEVYYVLLGTDHSKDSVRRAIHQAANPYPGLVGVVLTMTGERFSFRRGRITTDGLKNIADQAEKIIVGAYHGEGYLIWEGNRREEN